MFILGCKDRLQKTSCKSSRNVGMIIRIIRHMTTKAVSPPCPPNPPVFDLATGLRGARKQMCLVGRTYPDGKKHGMSRGYNFVPPGGEHTAWDMIARAIQVARNFIYIEDQYLVSGRASLALATRLRGDASLKRVVILTNNVTGVVEHKFPIRRSCGARFLNTLRQADPTGTRWSIFGIRHGRLVHQRQGEGQQRI
jgi:hypothetical protein